MNIFYKKRYDKFINSIKQLGERTFNEYTEIHHIIPRCLKGTNNKSNLIELTLREHFLAHWLLWKSYPEYLPLSSAFLQMNNKNSKVEQKKFQGRINSRTYQKLKTAVYNKLSELNTDKVRLKDQTGNNIVLSKEEYANQNDLVFHTKGKILVFDKKTNEQVYITTDKYYKNKEQYITRLSNLFPNHISQILYQFLDTDTNSLIKLSKKEAKKLNNKVGYKKYKQIVKHQISCIDENGKTYTVLLEEYQSNKNLLTHANQNKLPVFDIEEGIKKSITIDDYNLNKNRYQTSTKGKVLAKNSDGVTVLISKEEFQTENYVGITRGLRTVFNIETNSYVQVSEEEFSKNRKKYTGPCHGKVNVIDKITGERKQITKQEFDPTRYSGLGNKKLLFRCRNILTGREKNVNIYEWHLVKNQYEIIEHDKYIRALNKK